MKVKGILLESDEGCEFLVPSGDTLDGTEPLAVQQRKGVQWVPAKFSLRRRIAMAALGLLRMGEVAEQYGLAKVEQVGPTKSVLMVNKEDLAPGSGSARSSRRGLLWDLQKRQAI